MVDLVGVGSVALLLVAVEPDVVCIASTSVLLLVSCVWVCRSALRCSWLMLCWSVA